MAGGANYELTDARLCIATRLKLICGWLGESPLRLLRLPRGGHVLANQKREGCWELLGDSTGNVHMLSSSLIHPKVKLVQL